MFFNCIKTTARCLQRVNQLNTNNITPIIQMQKYCTWHHRQPVRIENEEEILNYAEEAAGPNEFIEEKKPIYKRTERLPLKVKPKTKQIKKKLQVTPDDSTHKEDGSFNITELKEDDRMLTYVINLINLHVVLLIIRIQIKILQYLYIKKIFFLQHSNDVSEIKKTT